MSKYVYSFGLGSADGRGDMKDLLGGKGAGLHEMSRAGIPVPAGFTITTEACLLYQKQGGKLTEAMEKEIEAALQLLEERAGKRLGDPGDPLLVSVRSGAKFSMPGMMDTVLNLGLNDRTVLGLAQKTGNPRFAWDSYRRFIQMFGNVVLGIAKDEFEHVLEAQKRKRKAAQDTELDAAALQALVDDYKQVVRKVAGRDFPQEVREQLRLARDAVFQSWDNPRAVKYRRLNNIPHDLGTAVNVQTMVFGNKGLTSATGVGFTRDPSNGEKRFYGEFLQNAQGEDVVAGTRTPRPIQELEAVMPEAYQQLREITGRLEKHYRDMQDFEFTIEESRLFMLQTRNGKRTGMAAIRAATDMVDEGLITAEEALLRVEPEMLDQLLHPVFDPKERRRFKAAARGLPAGPGAATGEIVFTADRAEELWKKLKGRRMILVRKETEPDDIGGMTVSQGVLTARGGMTSHAAVVGRQLGKVCVVGCEALVIDDARGTLEVGGKVLREGDKISIDGSSGEVILAEVPTTDSEVVAVTTGKLAPEKSDLYQRYARILAWADGARRMRVRANADIPRDAKLAFAFGAEGIGLCRTEHMFFARERLPIVQEMILADTDQARAEALKKLLPFQRADFYGLFKEMRGYPVTIRTLDPPLHEFLPRRHEIEEEIRRGGSEAKLKKLRKLLARVESLHEQNPMLGFRGCRLGIAYPEITAMQARAIFEAAARCVKEEREVKLEIMIPLVGVVTELARQKELVLEVARDVQEKKGVKIDFMVGTMIEVPRGALTADEIAREAEFFSFGTNDLTQMTFGYSRDDVGEFLHRYLDQEIIPRDPFVSIDQRGVGELMRIAATRGRQTRAKLKLGICGEHGGDPSSVAFCHTLGLDYVSCSPYRVPIARLAAAQATVREKLDPGRKSAA